MQAHHVQAHASGQGFSQAARLVLNAGATVRDDPDLARARLVRGHALLPLNLEDFPRLNPAWRDNIDDVADFLAD